MVPKRLGVVPDHSQRLLGHLRKNHVFKKRRQIMERRHVRKPFFVKRHLQKWTSYGSSGRSAKGKVTVHCTSFYKLGSIWGLALTINPNLHDFHTPSSTMGFIFSSTKTMGPNGFNRALMHGPNRAQVNEWA